MTVLNTTAAIGKRGFQVVTHDISEDVLVAIRAGTEQLREIGKTLGSMNQNLLPV